MNNKTYNFKDRQTADNHWSVGTIYPMQTHTVSPLEAKLIRCKIRKPDGSTVGPYTRFVGEINNLPFAADTDDQGSVRLYVDNTSLCTPLRVERGKDLGSAEHFDRFNHGHFATGENKHVVPELFEELSAGPATAPVAKSYASAVAGVRDNAPSKEKIEMIRQAVVQLPRDWQQSFREVLMELQDVISENKCVAIFIQYLKR